MNTQTGQQRATAHSATSPSRECAPGPAAAADICGMFRAGEIAHLATIRATMRLLVNGIAGQPGPLAQAGQPFDEHLT